MESDIVHGTMRELARHDAGDHRANPLNGGAGRPVDVRLARPAA
jgi:hypothetical protein